eukprot:7500042-Pyramimonas_sp.AAC.1
MRPGDKSTRSEYNQGHKAEPSTGRRGLGNWRWYTRFANLPYASKQHPAALALTSPTTMEVSRGRVLRS